MDSNAGCGFGRFCLAALALSGLAGCSLPEGEGGDTERWSRATIGASVEGRAIDAWIFDGRILPGRDRNERERGAEASETGGPTVLVVGGIHGDEPSGAELARLLVEHLKTHPAEIAGRRVIVVPEANPDGLSRGSRGNARGVDINRNFPARNFRPGSAPGPRARSEPETRAVLRVLHRYPAVLVLALHAPLACVDADGGPDAWALAREVSRVGGLPPKDLEALPGSLGSYVSLELGRSAITYELESGRRSVGRQTRHLRAILCAIAKPPRARAGLHPARPGATGSWVSSLGK